MHVLYKLYSTTNTCWPQSNHLNLCRVCLWSRKLHVVLMIRFFFPKLYVPFCGRVCVIRFSLTVQLIFDYYYQCDNKRNTKPLNDMEYSWFCVIVADVAVGVAVAVVAAIISQSKALLSDFPRCMPCTWIILSIFFPPQFCLLFLYIYVFISCLIHFPRLNKTITLFCGFHKTLVQLLKVNLSVCISFVFHPVFEAKEQK